MVQKKTSEKSASAKASQAKQKPASRASTGSRRKVAAIIGIIVIIVAIAGFSVYGLNKGPPQNASFSTFKQNFDSAKDVAIVLTYNTTTFPSTLGCATAVIEGLTGTAHRNESTIDFLILNGNLCTAQNGLGSGSGQPYNTTFQNCTRTASSEPSVYINYSDTNGSTITPTQLHIYGDVKFLAECGVASEIS
jgi:hypothetical protein